MFEGISLNAQKSALNNFDNLKVNTNNNGNFAKKIVLASKGEAGYSPQFDEDGDGIITLEEFNLYCEKNQVSEEDKMKLLTVMQQAKLTSEIQEKHEKAKKEEAEEAQEQKEKGKSIYARRGDRKYDERMDENKDNIVTYEEYQKYCDNIANKESKTEDSNSTATEKQAKEAYAEPAQEPEVSVEAEA